MFSLLFILGSCIIGFFVSVFLRHIRMTVHGKTHVSCPSYYDCELIISSKYTNFLGVPIEFLSAIYFGLIFFFYLSISTFPQLFLPWMTFVVVALTTAAFLFACYIAIVQLVEFKKICFWCLITAVLTAIVLLSSLAWANTSLITLLAEYKTVIVMLHLIGFALGVGGATITDGFFFKFLKDYHISKWEANILHHVSQFIWLGLGILIVSGIGLYLPAMDVLNHSTKFIAKAIIVLIITLNGILLNLYISPKMFRIAFGQKHKHRVGELHYLRKAAFASGAVSIVSWYSAFILGSLKSVPMSVGQILFIYVILLIVGIASALGVERYFDYRARVK
jgi:uncharacterized membrane protein